MQYAQHVLLANAPEYLSHRDPSHPLVILLSGTLFADSLRPLLLVQAAMSVLTIMFVFYTLAEISRGLALVAGWVALGSFIPFQYQNMIFNDHVFGFFFSLLCYTTVRALRQPTPMRLYDLTVAIGWIILSRLTLWTALLLPLCILLWGLKTLPRPARRKHAVCITVLFCLIFSLNYYCRYGQFISQEGVAPIRGQIGWQVLSSIYRFGYTVPKAFSPDDGPATAKLHEKLLYVFRNKSNFPHAIAGNTPEEKIEALFRTPEMDNFYSLYGIIILNDQMGNADVAIMKEQLLAHPQIILTIIKQAFLENAFAYYRYSIGADIPVEAHYHYFPNIYKITFMPLYFMTQTEFVAKGIGGHIEQEMLDSMVQYEYPDPLSLPWHIYYDVWFALLVSIASLTAYLGLIAMLVLVLWKKASLRHHDVRLFLLLNIMLWPPAMLVSAITYMTYRYHVETGTWLLAIGCLGGWFLWRLWQEVGARWGYAGSEICSTS